MSPTARYLQSLRDSRDITPAHAWHITRMMRWIANDIIQVGVNQP